MVSEYSDKSLTFPEDVQLAFSELSSTLGKVFEGGLLFGLPEMFFDVGLLWMASMEVVPPENLRPRESKSAQGDVPRFPTWSWMGWQCKVNLACWRSGFDCWKKPLRFSRAITSIRTIPLVQWYCHEHPDLPGRSISNH